MAMPIDQTGAEGISRRELLYLAGTAGLGLGLSGIWGCATDPVTGKSSMALYSREKEISLDQKASKVRLSIDYGEVKDETIKKYVSDVGNRIAEASHRPDMPYRFYVTNSPDINAFTFSGGSIFLSRGILSELRSEAELASVIGHEAGHVCARHQAEKATMALITNILLDAAKTAVMIKKAELGEIMDYFGGVGSMALLTAYSRENEREADALGMEYCSRIKLNPVGMQHVHEMLKRYQEKKGIVVTSALFQTHPLSDERIQNAKDLLGSKYSACREFPVNEERFMDNTKYLRDTKDVLERIQWADQAIMDDRLDEANEHYRKALEIEKDSTMILRKMTSLHMIWGNYNKAYEYAVEARNLNPDDPAVYYALGEIHMKKGDYGYALKEYERYVKKLPENTAIYFDVGRCYEKSGHRWKARRAYREYLKDNSFGDRAEYARKYLHS